MEIVELRSEAEVREGYLVMRELRPHLTEAAFFDAVAAMRPEGYRLFALRDDDSALVSMAGIAVRTNLYEGRHVYVYDLVTRSDARSQGHGRRLLAFVEEFAREQGCAIVSLTSGVQRVDAHRFYEAMGYARPSFVFRKPLGDP
jgi:GNAT superfamily N-acetyltransferase